MLFSSPVFFLFFAVYFLIHRVTPTRFLTCLIIAGSTVFYGWWKIEFVWLPYALMAIVFFGVKWMEAATDQPARKRRMLATVVVLFLPLLFFKYTNFIARDVFGVADGKLVDLALPLGISFLTFTLTAYLVDIYRGLFPAGQKFSTVLAYVLFFPHLIAGPILRPHELIPQLERARKRVLQYKAAIAIFTMGLVKKLVFADQIGGYVDAAYNTTTLDAWQALLAIYGFSLQIYCDFSGYTDMAIGLAMLLGLKLPNNFLRPYAANSLTQFWRRWHITLSSWLRDYLYIPLGGNRGTTARVVCNLMVTMILGGLWHGANWTFVVWGAMHGVGISFLHVLKRMGVAIRLPRFVGILLTFHFVTVAWVFFRAPDMAKALEMLRAPFTASWANMEAFAAHAAFPLTLFAIFLLLHRFDDHRLVKWLTRRIRPEILWPVLILFWMLAITLSQGSSAKFVYFDF